MAIAFGMAAVGADDVFAGFDISEAKQLLQEALFDFGFG